METLRTTVGMALLSALIAVLLTWPVAREPAVALIGSADSDSIKHLWTLWWFRTSLLQEGWIPVATHLVNYPAGMPFWPIEPLNGLIAAALPHADLVALANVLALSHLALSGFLAGVLCWRLTGDRDAGGLALAVVETSAFATFTLHSGVGELQQLWLLPLGLWLLVRLLAAPSRRNAVVLGAALVGAIVACFYYGFFLALALAVLGVDALLRGPERRRTFGRLALAAGVAIALTLPVVTSFAHRYAPDPSVATASAATAVEDPGARLDPVDLVRTRRGDWATGSKELCAYGGGRLLGLPLLLVAAVGLARQPRRAAAWWVLAAIGVILALGSHLSTDGRDLTWGGQPLALPFRALNRLVALGVQPINFPVRFLAVTLIGLCGAASFAIAGTRGPWRWLLVAVLAGNVVDVRARDLLPFPLPTFAPPAWPGLAAAVAQAPGAVLDLTATWTRDRSHRLRVLTAQMVHERPVQDVVIERVEGFRESGRLEAVALRFVRDLAPGTVRRDVALTADHTGDFVALHAAGFSWLLYTLDDPGQPAAVLVGLDRVLGAPVLSQDRLRLYRLPAPSVDPLRAAFFLDAHRRRVAELQGSGGLFNADGQIDLERPADAPPPPVANPGPTFIPPPPPLRR